MKIELKDLLCRLKLRLSKRNLASSKACSQVKYIQQERKIIVRREENE